MRFTLLATVMTALALPGEAAAFKCGDMGLDPVMLLDGAPVEMETLEEIDKDLIYSVQVTCWNPADSTLTPAPDAIPIIFVTSKAVIDAVQEELMRLGEVRLGEAQLAHFAAQGAYARHIGEFGLDVDPNGVDLAVYESGWNVTIRRPGTMIHKCVVWSDGEPEVQGPSCLYEEDGTQLKFTGEIEARPRSRRVR